MTTPRNIRDAAVTTPPIARPTRLNAHGARPCPGDVGGSGRAVRLRPSEGVAAGLRGFPSRVRG